MRKGSIKNVRINSEVLKELSQIIAYEVKDPRINPFTSVMDVYVAPDLKTCKVYVSVMGSDEDKENTMTGLNSAKGMIRSLLAKRMNMRNTPELTFILDESIEKGIEMMKFIDEVNRTVIKLVMPILVLLDNLHINPIHLKKFVVWFSNRYSRKYENSKLMSQPISVPWEKFMHEPVFLKEDILPFKKYEFEWQYVNLQ